MITGKALIYIPVFLFPILIATVNHGGSVVYVFILLLGLFLGWPAWRSLEPEEKRVLLGFSIFFILISLSFLNAQDYYNGVKKLEKYLLFPLLIPMYLLIKKYQVETGKVYLFGLLIASVVMFGQGYDQASEKYWQRAGGAYNALVFGDVAMLIAVIIFCALLTIAKRWWHYLFAAASIAMALTASVMSGAKGAWILLPVLMVWLLWLYRKKLRRVHIVSILVVFVLAVTLVMQVEKVRYRFESSLKEYSEYTEGTTKRSSIQSRIEFWRDSITIWKEYPIIGSGIGDFKFDVRQLMADGRSNSQQALGHAHNIYFNALAISGLVGLFALLIFVQIIPFLMFQSFWKKEHDPWIRFYALSGMATIIAFAVFGLTEDWLARNPFVRTYLMSILVFMSSIAIVSQKANQKANQDRLIKFV